MGELNRRGEEKINKSGEGGKEGGKFYLSGCRLDSIICSGHEKQNDGVEMTTVFLEY